MDRGINKKHQRPFECTFCKMSFRRIGHLNRHLSSHTNEKKYECSCGKQFNRSDVLAQHLRRCDMATIRAANDFQTSKFTRSRTKKACDRCAGAKVKCDFQNPCGRCLRQNVPCQFTREKPEDLYKEYRICENHTSSEFLRFDERPQTMNSPKCPPTGQSSSSFQLSVIPNANLTDSPVSELNFYHDIPDDLSNILSFWDPEKSGSFLDSPDLTYVWQVDSNPSFSSLYDPQPNHEMNRETVLFDTAELSMSSVAKPLGFNTYSDNDLDALRSKCTEIIGFMKLLPSAIFEDIEDFITPGNLRRSFTRFCEDPGYYSVLLHKQSLNTAWSSPVLLLAIMIVGDCHMRTAISMDTIIQIALSALNSIDTKTHEIQMEAPPLSTIQASVMITSFLVHSQNHTASKFLPKIWMRNISMIERTPVFTFRDATNYNLLTEKTFNWQQWIEEESLRRLACIIFCQDMSSCIFQGRFPTISPYEFGVILPCYENCWEASTSLRCLQRLRAAPHQITVSDAIGKTWHSSYSTGALFEASEFGMFVTICGLHMLLFQLIEFGMGCDCHMSESRKHLDLDELRAPASGTSQNTDRLLHTHFSWPQVALVADSIESSASCPVAKKANSALGSWMTTWENRLYRETSYERTRVTTDSLPFFWLAKLYIVLHCCEVTNCDKSQNPVARVRYFYDERKSRLQSNIIRWLSQLHGKKSRLEMRFLEVKALYGGRAEQTPA